MHSPNGGRAAAGGRPGIARQLASWAGDAGMETPSPASKFIISHARGNERCETCLLAMGRDILMTKHPATAHVLEASRVSRGMQAIKSPRPVAHESEQQRRRPRAIRDRGAYKGRLEPIVSFLPIRLEIREFPSNPKAHMKSPLEAAFIVCTRRFAVITRACEMRLALYYRFVIL